MPYILSRNQLDNFIKKNKLAGDSVVDFLKDTNYATKDLATYQKYLVDTGQTTTQFASMTKSAGNILKSFGATLASTGVMMLAGVAISGAAKLFSNWVNEAKNAETAASGFSESLNKLNSDYSSNSAKITELNKRYQELSKGVNSLGKNNSLTSSEYDEYKNIISQISDIMPSLSVRFDEQGDKIGFVKGQLEDLNEEYQKYQQNMASNLLYNGNDEGQTADDIIKNVKYQTSNPWYSSMFGGGWTTFKAALGHHSYDRLGLNYLFGDLKFDMDDVESLYSNKDIVSLANTLASYSKEDLVNALKENSNIGDDTYEGLIGYTANEVDKMTDAEFNAVIESLYDKADVFQNKIDSAYSKLRSSMILALQSNSRFYDLDEGSGLLTNIVSNLTNEYIDENNLNDNVKFTAFTNNLINQYKTYQDKINNIVDNLEDINPADLGNLSITEAKSTIDNYINQLSTYLGIDANQLKISLGFEDINTLFNDYNKVIASMQKNEPDFDWSAWFSNNSINTKEEIDLFNELREEAAEAGETTEELRQKYLKLSTTLTNNSNAFNLESFNKSTDSIQSAFSILSNAVKEYNNNGAFSLDTLQSLLALEPQYLAMLVNENGQLAINKTAMMELVQAQLEEAKSKLYQSAINDINAISAKNAGDAAVDAAKNRKNSTDNIDAETDAINKNTTAEMMNEAAKAKRSEAGVSAEEVDAIVKKYTNMANALDECLSGIGSDFAGVVGGFDETADKIKDIQRQIDDLENQKLWINLNTSLTA